MNIGRVLTTCCLLLLVAPMAHAAPSEGTIRQYLNKVESNAASRADEVQEHSDKMSDLVAPAEVNASGSANVSPQHWEFHRGASISRQREEFRKSSAEAVAYFQACQERSNQHSWFQISMPPVVVGTGCWNVFKYMPMPPLGMGLPSGLCIRCSLSWFCGCNCFVTDLVEYHYPAYLWDASEQMWQTPRYDNKSVKEYAKAIRDIDKSMVVKQTRDALRVLGKKAGEPIGNEITGDIQEAWSEVSRWRSANPSLSFSAPSGTTGYGRTFIEPLNHASLYQQLGVPHMPKDFIFGMDLPISFGGFGLGGSGGYMYSRFFYLSSIFSRQWQLLMSRGGERLCVRNNMSTGKSPYRVDGVSSPLRDTNKMCTNDVGEKFSVRATRRPHITDGTFQAIDKGLTIFEKAVMYIPYVPWVGRHTYKPAIDRWVVLGQKKKGDDDQNYFAAESPKCVPWDTLTRPNLTYNRANEVRIGKGGYNSMEVYPVFKGCWGFKGVPERWWKRGSCYGDIIEWSRSKLPNGKLRLD